MEKYSKLREPSVAGTFYPAETEALKKLIAKFIRKDAAKINALACMLPHAGYIYSGSVAGETLSKINLRDKIILIGPNHTGNGPAFSIMTQGIWKTPLGEIHIDSALAAKVLKHSKYLENDSSAHQFEHSLEVELPFLQYLKKDFEIVPILVSSGQIQLLKEIGRNLADAIIASGMKDSTLLIASTDMTHYESQASAEKKDSQAIEAILELNEEKLIEKIAKSNITMCGYAPVIIMLSAAKALGAKQATLVKYQTSGDVTADKTSVVGYAGIAVY